MQDGKAALAARRLGEAGKGSGRVLFKPRFTIMMTEDESPVSLLSVCVYELH